MSFDVFLQRFVHGKAGEGDGRAALAVLEPFIAERDGARASLTFPDGDAVVLGVDTPSRGLMFTQVGGRVAWDVIHDVAHASGFVVMPVGWGTLLPEETSSAHLPRDAPEPIRIVRSGREILAAIETSQ